MKLILPYAASHGLALLLALLVHVVVGVLISTNWQDTTFSYDEVRPYYIEATMVDRNPYAGREQKNDGKRQRLLEDRRVEEARLRAEHAAWEKSRASRADQPELTEQETQPTGPDVEEVRAAFAKELAQALWAEENARKAVTDDEKAMAYVAQMQREIIQNWSRPPSARNGMTALLRVRLIPTGEVIDVKLEETSGNAAFDRSAIQAVQKTGRFVVPSDSRQFEKRFREFTVLFRPDDLRL